MSVPVAAYLGHAGERLGERIERAHAKLDETRCVAWLRATGNRPVSPYPPMSDGLPLTSQPQPVHQAAEPRPEEGCPIHPTETTRHAEPEI